MRLRELLDEVPVGTVGIVARITPYGPWPVIVDFSESITGVPCREAELEPLS